MAFKRYGRIQLLLICLLVISGAGMGWALTVSRFHLAMILFVWVCLLGWLQYRKLSRTNREILFFFKALENDDTSIKFSSNHRNRFINELHHYLDALNRNFQRMKVDSELREQYFSRILENLASGLLVYSATGHINHINQEALRLLEVSQLTHIKALAEKYHALYQKITGMNSLDQEKVTLQGKSDITRKILGLQMVEIMLQGEAMKVVTIQDLTHEMERKEIDDWIRLIRVLSHEIMNSLAPITSISTTLKEVWTENVTEQSLESDPKIQQTLKGLDAIAEQSEGLTTFFESYRVLSRIPDPVKREIQVCTMFEKLETLVIHNDENAGISITFSCEDPTLTLEADEQMITQVMLNLIKNAGQALEGATDPAIHIHASRREDSRAVLSITDNGSGISPEISNEIFMPFFTTRKKGTGVGLSYSRQVMAMNDGKIEFDSRKGRTEFRLVF